MANPTRRGKGVWPHNDIFLPLEAGAAVSARTGADQCSFLVERNGEPCHSLTGWLVPRRRIW